MWMGGCAPLGYDIRERRLVVNPAGTLKSRSRACHRRDLQLCANLTREPLKGRCNETIRVSSDAINSRTLDPSGLGVDFEAVTVNMLAGSTERDFTTEADANEWIDGQIPLNR
jgi:hypothetical protein